VGAEGMKVNLITEHHPEIGTERSHIAIPVIYLYFFSELFDIKLFRPFLQFDIFGSVSHSIATQTPQAPLCRVSRRRRCFCIP